MVGRSKPPIRAKRNVLTQLPIAEQIPTCTSDAQALPVLMNELKSVLNCSVLDNRAVLVGLLPKHHCCAGSCHEVEPQEDKNSFEGRVESGKDRYGLEAGVELGENNESNVESLEYINIV